MKRRRGGPPESLGAVVQRVLTDLGEGDAARAVRIAERWEEAVGPEVASHCRPAALRSGILEANVDSSVWCQQLSLRRPEILAALRRVLGDEAPRDVRLRVGAVDS